MTKKEAAEKWLNMDFNTMQRSMFEVLHRADPESWVEVTTPAVGDSVYHHDSGVTADIVAIFDDNPSETLYRVGLDDGGLDTWKRDDFEVEHYGILPDRHIMYQFSNTFDNAWLDEQGGIEKMSACGFRIYEHQEFGHVFGLDSGYNDFWQDVMIPLYEARGLQWHEQEKVAEGNFYEEFQAVCEIENHLAKAQDTYNQLPNEVQELLLGQHSDNANLAHCLRWGTQAASEIRADWATVVSPLEAEKSKKDTITVLIVEPEKAPYQAEIGKSLADKQAVVGGTIQAVYPYEDEVALVCNDEGKMAGLDLNRGLYDEQGELYDIVAGTFFICGLGEEDFCSLTPEQAEKFTAMFREPEMFAKINGKLQAVKIPQDVLNKGKNPAPISEHDAR